ncbi:MAG: exosortase/archaeosortase family protein [Phycisphaerae bacterium]
MEIEKSISPAGRGRRIRSETVTWDQIIGPAGWVKIVVLGVLLGWLYWGELRYMVDNWINNANWSHGFIIPVFSLYFLHQRREQLYKAGRQFDWFNWVGLVMVVLSILMFLVSIYPLKMGYPKLIALLMTLFGVVLFCCGWRVIRVTWLPILFLFFAMPIPARWYESLTMQPRIWASQVSVVVLGLIPQMEVTANGVIIEGFYKGQSFNLSVAEACAGMRLMMAFLALGVAMAYLSDRPFWHRIILVVSTLPIALFCNFTRVVITGLLYVLVSPIFAKGGFHTTLGLLMLPVAFFMYWVIAGILNRVYEEVEVQEPMHE